MLRERDGLLKEHADLIGKNATRKTIDEVASLKSKLFELQEELDE
ncbi:MAG: hypothetical protein ACKPKO_05020 [Candidatus Fonsibacter sp.]